MKKQVYLFEISDITENQVKLPYSTGLIWGHCILDNAIKSNYELGGWIYYRDKIDCILSKVENPSIVGFSNFVERYIASAKNIIDIDFPEPVP